MLATTCQGFAMPGSSYREPPRNTGKKCEMQLMDESQRAQIETYLSHLDGLIRRGRQVREALSNDPSNSSAIAAATDNQAPGMARLPVSWIK